MAMNLCSPRSIIRYRSRPHFRSASSCSLRLFCITRRSGCHATTSDNGDRKGEGRSAQVHSQIQVYEQFCQLTATRPAWDTEDPITRVRPGAFAGGGGWITPPLSSSDTVRVSPTSSR